VVGHPVKNDFKALFMGGSKEVLEVRTGTELGVDSAVINDGIVTA